MSGVSTLARSRRRRGAQGSALRLRPHDVDIWRAALDDHADEVLQWMHTLISADEAERARRFYFERDRRRFIVGRGILRMLLGRYLNRAPADLLFRYGANGKPAIATVNGGPPPIYFNVAHSEGLALYAFTRVGEVGIDVELVREIPELEQIAQSYFAPPEVARIRACPEERRRDEFFRAWTRQEAVLKAHGIGLGGAAPAATSPARQRRGADGAPELAGAPPHAFCLHALRPAPGFVGALAVGPTGRWSTCTTWQPHVASDQSAAPRRGRRTRLEPASDGQVASL